MLTTMTDGPCITPNFSQRRYHQQEVSISQALVATAPRIVFERNTKPVQRRHLGLFQDDQPREQHSRRNTPVRNWRAVGFDASSSQPVLWSCRWIRHDAHIRGASVDNSIFAALVTRLCCPGLQISALFFILFSIVGYLNNTI